MVAVKGGAVDDGRGGSEVAWWMMVAAKGGLATMVEAAASGKENKGESMALARMRDAALAKRTGMSSAAKSKRRTRAWH